VPLTAAHMCMVGEQSYLLAYRDGRLVQRMDLDEALTASFEQPFCTGRGVGEQRSAHGRILCDPATQSVYTAAEASPQLRRYREDGE
jgi:hypothetical protein